MKPSGRRRIPIVAALTTALIGAGALIGLGADAASGPLTLNGATLEWGFNGELNAGAFDGSCNHLSAGQTDGSQAMYSGTDRDVTVVKRAADGTYATVTDWATRCLDANGTRVTAGGAGGTARLGLLIRLSGGDGTHDPATGATTVQWHGSFSANMYDELIPQWFTDPRLVIDATGRATLTATLAGYASSLDNPDIRQATPPIAGVVVARFDVAAAGADGFTATPEYAGVAYESIDAPQVRTGAWWGAWPSELIGAMERTGSSAYWYSTGSVADPRKAPSPITVRFGPMIDSSTTTTAPTTTTTTSVATSSTSTTVTVPGSTTTSTTVTVPGSTTTSTTVPTTTSTTSTTVPTTVPTTTSTTTTSTTVPTTVPTTTSTTAPTATTTTRPPESVPAPGTLSPSNGASVGSATIESNRPESAQSKSAQSSAANPTANPATNPTPARANTSRPGAGTASTATPTESADQSMSPASTAAPAAGVRTLDASLRYSALTAEYRPNLNPARPGAIAVTYTVQNTGDVTVAAKGTAAITPAVGPAADTPTSVRAIAPGRSRTVTQVVEGIWPGFGTESAVRLTPYVPAEPGLDLDSATIAARTSATVWPWQQVALIAVLLGVASAAAAWLVLRRRTPSS